MEDNSSNIINLQGIVHNQSQIEIKDGQAEDLVNLRFKDGSWRTSGDGKHVFSFGDTTYDHIFVHTNSYRHLIGVRNNALYWFASIEDDNKTFNKLEKPIILIQSINVDELSITQTGHLIVVLQYDNMYVFFYNGQTDNYELQSTEEEALLSDVQFKCECEQNKDGSYNFMVFHKYAIGVVTLNDTRPQMNWYLDSASDVTRKKMDSITNYNSLCKALKYKGYFSGCFLACVAVQLYDDSWVYATQPILVCPSAEGDFYQHTVKGEILNNESYKDDSNEAVFKHTVGRNTTTIGFAFGGSSSDVIKYPLIWLDVFSNMPKSENVITLDSTIAGPDGGFFKMSVKKEDIYINETVPTTTIADYTTIDGNHRTFSRPYPIQIPIKSLPSTFNSQCWTEHRSGASLNSQSDYYDDWWGKCNKLKFRIGSIGVSKNAVYKNIGIFVSDVFPHRNIDTNDVANTVSINYGKKHTFSNTGYTHGEVEGIPIPFPTKSVKNYILNKGADDDEIVYQLFYASVEPKRNYSHDSLRDMINSATLHCVKKYDINEVHENEWISVDIEDGVLNEIGDKDLLPVEAFQYSQISNSQVQYMYNGRLHLANYKTSPDNSDVNVFTNNDLSEGGYSSDDSLTGVQIKSSKNTTFDAHGYNSLQVSIKPSGDTYAEQMVEDGVNWRLPQFIPLTNTDNDGNHPDNNEIDITINTTEMTKPIDDKKII